MMPCSVGGGAPGEEEWEERYGRGEWATTTAGGWGGAEEGFVSGVEGEGESEGVEDLEKGWSVR